MRTFLTLYARAVGALGLGLLVAALALDTRWTGQTWGIVAMVVSRATLPDIAAICGAPGFGGSAARVVSRCSGFVALQAATEPTVAAPNANRTIQVDDMSQRRV